MVKIEKIEKIETDVEKKVLNLFKYLKKALKTIEKARKEYEEKMIYENDDDDENFENLCIISSVSKKVNKAYDLLSQANEEVVERDYDWLDEENY